MWRKDSEVQGFTLKHQESIAEEQATLLFYEHDQTGAQVYHLKNEDPNKTFAISFRTKPIGSTGNMHIMEHAVLNGSRKYRTKEPFMDMIQSSLQTFLNAMTYPDKTVFPVASRNDRDFLNLTDVYLDAVFHPKVLEDERIFRQEGWRREIFHEEDPITYQGVVYNEMKGAMSAPERQVYQQIQAALLPETIYAENSGGDVAAIPSLSYEDFVAYHQTSYHPSNAIIFYYGAIDEELTFAQLASFLDEYERVETDDTLPEEVVPFAEPRRVEETFDVADEEPTERKSYLALSWLVDEARTDWTRYLYQLLGDVLIQSESSPLRRALFQELKPTDLYGELIEGRQIGFSIMVKETDAALADRFAEIVQKTLRQWMDEGISKDVLDGILNAMEFGLREKHGAATKGIVFMEMLNNEATYGADPFPVFHYEQQLAALREALNEGALEDYIRTHLLENAHCVLSVHRPEAGKNRKREEETRERLAAYKESLSPEELRELIRKNEALRERQNAENTPEEKATLPLLPREELPEQKERIPREVRHHGEDVVLFHDLPTSGIHYLDLAFDLSHISLADAPYAMLVVELLGRLDTEKYDYKSLEIHESQVTGGVAMYPVVISREETDGFARTLLVSTKLLARADVDTALDVLDQEMFHTQFTDRERLAEQIRIIHSDRKMSVVPSGHAVAMARALAHINPKAAYDDQLKGLGYLTVLTRLAENLTDADVERLESVYALLFAAGHRVVNVTSHGASAEAFIARVLDYLDTVPARELEPAPVAFTPWQTSEAFTTTSDVQYNAVAAPYVMEHGLDGQRIVLASILETAILYNEIRAKGGAYGQSASFTMDGEVVMASYRDPRLDETYAVFEHVGERVEALPLSTEDLDRFIIGAVGRFDRPLTESMKGLLDLRNYLVGHDADWEDQRLREMKATTVDDIRREGARLTKAIAQATRVTIGNPQAVEGARTAFETVSRI